ncbi:hypothetical protein LINPERPRIM_LOCUS31243 [Linum perenne]
MTPTHQDNSVAAVTRCRTYKPSFPTMAIRVEENAQSSLRRQQDYQKSEATTIRSPTSNPSTTSSIGLTRR